MNVTRNRFGYYFLVKAVFVRTSAEAAFLYF